jgi:hypothetical protein
MDAFDLYVTKRKKMERIFNDMKSYGEEQGG